MQADPPSRVDSERRVSRRRDVLATARRLRPAAELAVGASSVSFGIALLVSNVSGGLALGSISAGWIPISANLALVGGGIMFVREFIRHRRERRVTAR